MMVVLPLPLVIMLGAWFVIGHVMWWSWRRQGRSLAYMNMAFEITRLKWAIIAGVPSQDIMNDQMFRLEQEIMKALK